MGVYPGYVPMGAYPGYSYHSRRKISFAFYSGVILSHVSHPWPIPALEFFDVGYE